MLNSRYLKLFSVMAISLLGIIVYSNTFFHPFHFDDMPYILNNPSIRNIQDLQSIWNFWPCRFIFCLSVALNYHLHQYNVFGYHLFNLAIHLGAAILVWQLTLLTFSTPVMKREKVSRHADLIALLTGLIFVAHPIQTQAVTYISQRATSIAALFYLASLIFYIKLRLVAGRKGRLYYILSLVTAIAAMVTKENAITLPLMFLLYEFTFFNHLKSFNWKRFIPFALTILIIPYTILFLKPKASPDLADVLSGSGGVTQAQYILTEPRVLITYIRLEFLPLNQNLDYDYHIFKSIFDLPVLISCLVLIAILFLTKRLFSKYRIVSFSILWFFLTLLPESSIFPIKDLINEHRLYLPMVGFGMFLVCGFYYLFERKSLKAMVITLSMIIAFYAVLTYQRNKVWRDEITLWSDVITKSPHKARGYNNRGSTYFNQGDPTKALADFNEAIAIDPDYSQAYYNRGVLYDKQGDLAQALSDYNRAIEINPGYAEAYYSRGILSDKQGNYVQALSDYIKAITIKPDYSDVYVNRGIFYARQGDLTLAMSDFTKCIELNPSDAKAYYNRGLANVQLGNPFAAISDYSKAIAIDHNYLDAYYNRGLSYIRQDDFTQALDDFNKDIGINPNDAQAYNDRAVVYYQLKDYDKAWGDVHKAESLGVDVSPDFISLLKRASGIDK